MSGISFRSALLWIVLDIIVIMYTSDIEDIRYMQQVQDESIIYNSTVVKLVLWYKNGLRFMKCGISNSMNKMLLNEGKLDVSR